MAIKYNLIGIPTVENAAGIFAEADKVVEVTQASNPEVSIGSVLRAAIGLITGALQMLIDPFSRSIKVSDQQGLMTPQTANRLLINPVDGQTGRTLAWQASASTGTVPAELKTAIDALNAAVVPKRSMESQVAAILDAVPDAYKDRIAVLVDQASAGVNVFIYADQATKNNAIDAATMTGTNQAVFGLSGERVETAASTGDTSLPFEGGVISLP